MMLNINFMIKIWFYDKKYFINKKNFINFIKIMILSKIMKKLEKIREHFSLIFGNSRKWRKKGGVQKCQKSSQKRGRKHEKGY